MDQEDFIKIEPESPIKTSSNLANYYMTQFYDQDSGQSILDVKRQFSQEAQTVTSSDQLLQKLDVITDLRTLSVSQIIQHAQNSYIIQESFDWKDFEAKLRKKKLVMKRNHAKYRNKQVTKQQYFVMSNNVEGVNIKEQIQAQIKKKRNRMSAQISRDRRKIKIQQLEFSNEKLKAQTEKIMQENEKLKKQLQQFNKAEDKKTESPKGKNKFLSFIIMLGMFFFLSILKENIKGNGGSLKVASKLTKSDHQIYSAQQQFKTIEDSQKAFKDFQTTGQALLGNRKVMRNVLGKLEEMKSHVEDAYIPKYVKSEILLIKQSLNQNILI